MLVNFFPLKIEFIDFCLHAQVLRLHYHTTDFTCSVVALAASAIIVAASAMFIVVSGGT